MQGRIGDCFLISPILCIMFSNLPLLRFIFPYIDYHYYSSTINMRLYKDGIRTEIKFKNTYAYTNENKLMFSKPLDDSFIGLSIEKGYAAFKSDKYSISSGFNKINDGGNQLDVFQDFFGTVTELYNFCSYNGEHLYVQKEDSKDKVISQYDLRDKIEKYINNNGLITFSVFFNIGRENKNGEINPNGHAFSVIGYKVDYFGKLYVEILNPHRSGKYSNFNIKKNDEYEKLSSKSKEEFDSELIAENIKEEEFCEELKQKFIDFEKTGYLIMEFNTFYRWIADICFCDPMLNCYETIFELNWEDIKEITFQVDEPTKFKAFLTYNGKKIDKYNPNKIILEHKGKRKYYESHEELIYENLERGDYVLDIQINSNNYNIDYLKENIFYLKIQSDEVIFNKKNKFDLYNSTVYISDGGNGYFSLFNNINYLKALCQLMKLVEYFYESEKKMDGYDFSDLYYIQKSYSYYSKVNYIEKNKIIFFPNLYFHYINIAGGCIILIINKYKFSWNCINRFIYNNSSKKITAYFSFGSFELDNDLIISNFDEKFKKFINYVTDSYYYEFCLNEVDKIIEKNKSLKKINYDSNKEISKPNEKIGEKVKMQKEKYIEAPDKITSLLKEEKINNDYNYSSDSHIALQMGNSKDMEIHPTNRFRDLKDYLSYHGISRDEFRDTKIIINGNLYTADYIPHHLDEKIRNAMRSGKNIRFKVFK